MKALWLTDIHLEFLDSNGIDRFLRHLSAQEADIVLVGGDIGNANILVSCLREMEKVLSRPIYFVLGNHDYYQGGIDGIQSQVIALSDESNHLRWLSNSDVVSLSPKTALIGHDSWADGRYGNFESSNVELNDFHCIQELSRLSQAERLQKMQSLADKAVQHLGRVLPDALQEHEEILLLTHVPPFREATWHEGKISGDDWLPFFSCEAVGDLILETMRENKQANLTVLCGHTHGAGTCEILPNLLVRTGAAEYRRPAIQDVLEIG